MQASLMKVSKRMKIISFLYFSFLVSFAQAVVFNWAPVSNNRRLLQTSTCQYDKSCASYMGSAPCSQGTFCPNFPSFDSWDVMHRCGVNKNSTCQVTVLSGQSVNDGAFGIDRIFDSNLPIFSLSSP